MVDQIMNIKPDLYRTEDREEIFWIITSFLSEESEKQAQLIKLFSLKELPSDFSGSIHSEILKNIGWCFVRYIPDYLGQRVYKPSIELYALLKLMLNFDVLQRKAGYNSLSYPWSIQSVKEDDIWSLVRRLSNLILKEWGMDLYPFGEVIDLDYIGPEVV